MSDLHDDHDAPAYDDLAVPASADEYQPEKLSITQRMTGGIRLSPLVRTSFFALIALGVIIVFYGIFHMTSGHAAAAVNAPVQPADAYAQAAAASPSAGTEADLDLPTSASTPTVANQTVAETQRDQSVNDALANAANQTSTSANALNGSHHGMAGHPAATLAPIGGPNNGYSSAMPPMATDAPAGTNDAGGSSVPNPGSAALHLGTPMPSGLSQHVADAQAAHAGDDDLYVGDNNVGQQSTTTNAVPATLASSNGPVPGAAVAQPPAAPANDDEQKPAYLQTRHQRPLGQYEIWAGTTIPVQLDTAITTTAGKSVVVAHTTEDIYDSKTGQVLVIPKFSRILGHAAGTAVAGQNRVAVGWDRLIWIDGSYQDLDDQEGADREGNNGLFADVHEPNILATSLLTGLIAGGAQLLAGGASAGSNVQVGSGSIVGSSVGGSLAQAGGTIIQKKANEAPELTVPRGQRFSVVLDRTMLLEPWRYDDTSGADH